MIARAAESLRHDAQLFDPSHAIYSPFGIVYGFCADILSNMVLNTLRFPSSTGLSLEDTFISRETLEQKRDQAQDWQRLPKGERERDPFEHSSAWAGQIFARLVTALDARAALPAEPQRVRSSAGAPLRRAARRTAGCIACGSTAGGDCVSARALSDVGFHAGA